MRINEIFYSIQGEGRYIGTPSLFIRTQGCNFRCSFCDTKYTWDIKKGKYYSIDELVEITKPYKHIVITGGEPLLQKDLEDLLFSLKAKEVEVESNGYFYIDKISNLAHFNISPKLQYLNKDYLKSLQNWNGKVDFKFVVRDYNDYKLIDKLVQDYNLKNVILMPEGVDKDKMLTLTRKMIEWIKEDKGGYRVIPRLHILLWDNQRSV